MSVLSAAAMLQAGCAGGPSTVLTRAGPAQAGQNGLVQRFATDEAAARRAVGTPAESNSAAVMLRSGLGLVQASCDDYFRSAGKTQRWTIVGRQLLGVVGAAATAAMAIEGEDSDHITYLALGTSTANSGLDIYSENFLFSAENIDAVRTLIMKVLSVHSDEVLNLQQLSYASASGAIMDNQAFCQPRAIAALVRTAIAEGDVEADPSSRGASDLNGQLDRVALRELGELLGATSALSMTEAGALWWLLNAGATREAIDGPIKAALEHLPKGPFAGGAYNPNWSAKAVATTLESFSPDRKAAFQKEAQDQQSQIAAMVATGAPLMLPAASFSQSPLERPGSTRIGIVVK